MCGRFALHAPLDVLKSHFKIHDHFKMADRYNIAPSQMIPVIKENPPRLEFMRWGFIPKWAKAKDGSPPKPYINARSEGIEEKPTFRHAIKKQRCLIPASGYYEWKTIKDKKQPYYITQPENPLIAFAGIWDSWLDPASGQVETTAILTTDALGEMKRIHDRMPLIIPEENFTKWLAPSLSDNDLKSLCLPVEAVYEIRPVSTRVNNPKFDDPVCIQSL